MVSLGPLSIGKIDFRTDESMLLQDAQETTPDAILGHIQRG